MPREQPRAARKTRSRYPKGLAVQKVPNDLYALLGVEPTASSLQIRRAYRRRLVASHRKGVIGIVDHLEKLQVAYATLRESSSRNAYDQERRRQLASQIAVPPPPRSPAADEAARTEGSLRMEGARDLSRHSLRLGQLAVATTAVAVGDLATEHEEREARDAQNRMRRARIARAVRAVILGLLVGLVWALARRLAGR
jgi:curved DNA-binding protein CbpA